ncbi:TPA: hypothetical protein ACK1B7_004039 [Serratia marcescens]
MKEELNGLANHIASAKGGLPQEWQDWAEGIEADIRKLANREAQPVGFYTTVSGRKGVIWHNGAPEDDTAIYTAPPAPAVPDDLVAAVNRLLDCDGTRGHYSAIRCGDAREEVERLLAQPVSSGYTVPEGFKLMPLEMTDEIGEAIAMEARCCGGIALCIYEAALAAAPEGGNG